MAYFTGFTCVRCGAAYSEINAMYCRLIASGRVKWYDCGTDNPFRYEGKKTYAYEIAQALGWAAVTPRGAAGLAAALVPRQPRRSSRRCC
jgi:threonine synthase